MNLRTNSLQEGRNDRGLSIDSIQEELTDEHLQFKGHMIRARSKRLGDQATRNSKDMKTMTWNTFEG